VRQEPRSGGAQLAGRSWIELVPNDLDRERIDIAASDLGTKSSRFDQG
jgi:hypothetical protein